MVVIKALLGTLVVPLCGSVWLARTVSCVRRVRRRGSVPFGAARLFTRGDGARLREVAELLACTSRHWCCLKVPSS